MSGVAVPRSESTGSADWLDDRQFRGWLVSINGCVPLALLIWDAVRGTLGTNAVNDALHITGLLALVFLFLTLLVTPLRVLFGWTALIAHRRALGLFGFFYAVVHAAIYVGFDRALNLTSTAEEIASRRYLQVGLASLLLMVPLAVTSTNAMIRRLGAKRWKLLHRLVYLVAILGVLHYYMLVKSDVRQPLAFAAVLTPLLGFRAVRHYVNLRHAAAKPAGRPVRGAVAALPRFWKGSLRVARVFEETHDTRTFRLTSPSSTDLPFVFQAGQYLTVTLSIDGRDVRRSYTISSSPACRAYCEITVKREETGTGSRHLHDRLREGDLLQIAAPAGRFVFDPGTHAGVVLIGGGVGVTPMMSLLRSLTDRSWPGTIFFVQIAKTSSDLIFAEELRFLAARFPNLRLLLRLTREPAPAAAVDEPTTLQPDGPGVAVARGRLTGEAIRNFVPQLQELRVYLCGPDAMMAATRTLLEGLDVPEANILTETFVSPPTPDSASNDAAESRPKEADAPVANAVVTFTRSQRTADIDAGTTILEAAEAAGIALPYECRSGICGQCKVRLSSGGVAMETRDALSGKEQSAGDILACQARPTTTTVIVEA